VVSQSETLGVISDKPHNKIKTLFTDKKNTPTIIDCWGKFRGPFGILQGVY
jgi:hypothetical protein